MRNLKNSECLLNGNLKNQFGLLGHIIKNDWPGLYKFIPKVILEIIFIISKSLKVNLIVNKKITNIKKLINSNKITNIKFHNIKTDRIWLS